MIVIRKPTVQSKQNKSFLSAEILLENHSFATWMKAVTNVLKIKGYERLYKQPPQQFEMWFAVTKEYEPFLCKERADAFLVAILYFAMLTGEDIKCEAPLTDKLYYQLQYYLIPMLCNSRSGYRPIKIFGDLTEERYPSKGDVGTGISCGVDSLSTIFTHIQDSMPRHYRLTFLASFNTGAFHDFWVDYLSGISLEEWNAKANREFEIKTAEGKEVAKELGLQFVSVDSNISDLYQGVFLLSHTYRNCSAVLALQGLWGTYYYSSSGKPQFKKISLDSSSANYDSLLLNWLSTPTLSFYSSGMPYPRIEKTEMIADFDVAQKHLNVCTKSTNCGQCIKCRRTITTLMVLGKLDNFLHLFNKSHKFTKYPWRNYGWLLSRKKEDYYLADIYDYLERRNIRLSPKSILYSKILHLSNMAGTIWKRFKLR